MVEETAHPRRVADPRGSEHSLVRRIELAEPDPLHAARLVAAALLTNPVVHLVPVLPATDVRSFYDDVIERLGTPAQIGEDHRTGGQRTGERWMEVRYDPAVPDDAAFRYSKNAQPLHTDESYVSDPVGTLLMYCVAAAEAGGSTLFLGARDIIAELRRSRPELLSRLTSTPVRHQKADDRTLRPILDDVDGVPKANFNFFALDPAQDESAIQLGRDFFQLLTDELAPRSQRVRLRPGEAVVWDDTAVLHGRDAFAASRADERLLWKAGVRLGPSRTPA